MRQTAAAPSSGEEPVLVEPSPEVSASLTIYAPVWLGPEDLVAALGGRMAGEG